METRKVQRTGKSTFVVSLPKSWATKNSVNSGSMLFISQNQNGDLILTTDRSEMNLKTEINIGDKVGEPLFRDIIGCYLAGYRTIEVTSPRMSSIQKSDLHKIVTKLIGPEILEETINEVVIQDFLSSEELQFDQALKRMMNLVKAMVQDSISALQNNNKELALDVMQRDNDVDRLNLLIARQFAELLRSGSMKKETYDSITAFNYMQAASYLERIADHASKISEISGKHNYELPQDITEELSHLRFAFGSLLDGSLLVLLHCDSNGANKLIDSTMEARKQAQILADSARVTDKDEMLVRLVVSRSVERMLDYIINIGEQAINLCNARY
jgi:phosphate uptake regulator